MKLYVFYFFILVIIHYLSMMLICTIQAGFFPQILIPYYFIVGILIFLLGKKIFHIKFYCFLLFHIIISAGSWGLFLCMMSISHFLLSDFLEHFWIFIFRAKQDPLSVVVLGILNISSYFFCVPVGYIVSIFSEKLLKKINQ